ncbi:MAG: PD40 domain-containing protein [Salinivirgaceae bacterium]|nr:PD40 domain-containing protein [Salinivirgaceae bacterium]
MLLNKRLLAIVFSMLSLVISASAQDQQDISMIRKYAENAFNGKDYEFALENYLQLYKYDKENIDVNYKIGICYTETNIDKEKAVPFLEYVASFNNKPIRTAFFLGRAYMYNYRFTEAIEAFYEYKTIGVDEKDLLETDRMIDMCYYVLELINVPQNVTFTRLDTTINTKYDEMVPVVSYDNTMLYFSSNSNYIKEYEDYIYSGFYSEMKKGSWQSAVRIPISSYDNENVVGVSNDGTKVLVYANGDYATHDIKMYHRKGVKFTKAQATDLPADMNTEDVEMGACFSPDGSTLYYASDKPGGRGGLDLYMSRKGADGKWGPSELMSSVINTEYDENYPSLSADGKTLYFASKGHDCIGGYDIFRSYFDEASNSWTRPQNLGFPINTPLDNTKISFTADGKTAYVAAKRKEGMGNLDIYRIDFGDPEMQPSIYIGTVNVGESEGTAVPHSDQFQKAYATVYDQHGNIYAQWVVEEGQFFASLFPGKYDLEVKFEGQTTGYKESINIKEGDWIEKTILLKPVK